MTLTIKGRVISKKNNKQIIRRGSRPFIISSKAYQRFEKEALKQTGRRYKPIEANIFVDYTFLMKGKGSTDADNMLASINDILEKANIIKNDKQIKSGSFRIIADQPEYITEVTIMKL